jgi:hypothetical protein
MATLLPQILTDASTHCNLLGVTPRQKDEAVGTVQGITI